MTLINRFWTINAAVLSSSPLNGVFVPNRNAPIPG